MVSCDRGADDGAPRTPTRDSKVEMRFVVSGLASVYVFPPMLKHPAVQRVPIAKMAAMLHVHGRINGPCRSSLKRLPRLHMHASLFCTVGLDA